MLTGSPPPVAHLGDIAITHLSREDLRLSSPPIKRSCGLAEQQESGTNQQDLGADPRALAG
jgi:hypothetical protein